MMIMMVEIIIMTVMMVIFMIVMTKITKRHRNDFSLKNCHFKGIFLRKKEPMLERLFLY